MSYDDVLAMRSQDKSEQKDDRYSIKVLIPELCSIACTVHDTLREQTAGNLIPSIFLVSTIQKNATKNISTSPAGLCESI